MWLFTRGYSFLCVRVWFHRPSTVGPDVLEMHPTYSRIRGLQSIYIYICVYIYKLYIYIYIQVYRTIHTCMHTYMHAYIHSYIHACMHPYMHAYIHACIHTYIHACMHAYIHACIHTYIHACMHTSMHACIHTCMHAYIYTYYTYYTYISGDTAGIQHLMYAFNLIFFEPFTMWDAPASRIGATIRKWPNFSGTATPKQFEQCFQDGIDDVFQMFYSILTFLSFWGLL